MFLSLRLLSCLLCNTAVVVDFVFGNWNNESINIMSHSSVPHFFVRFTFSKSIPLSLDPGAAQVHAKLIDGFRTNLANLRFGQIETNSDVG